MPTKERQQVIKKAISRFDSLTPTLSGFASAISGKPIVVKAGQSTSTNGKVITILPPISLAEDTPHERSKCDKRDEDMQLLCTACLSREMVMTQMFHEISHVAFNSFNVEITTRNINAMGAYLPDGSSAEGKFITNIRHSRVGVSYDPHQLAGDLNEFMPVLLNAIEDIRVDTRMTDARRGVRVMHEAQFIGLAKYGYSGVSGKPRLYKDIDLNAQACIGIIAKAKGYDVEGVLNEYVIASIDTDKVSSLIAQVPSAESLPIVFTLGFKILVEMQALGFFVYDELHDYSTPEPEEEDDDDTGPGDGSQDESNPGDGERSEEGDGGEVPEGSGGDETDGDDSPSGRDEDLPVSDEDEESVESMEQSKDVPPNDNEQEESDNADESSMDNADEESEGGDGSESSESREGDGGDESDGQSEGESDATNADQDEPGDTSRDSVEASNEESSEDEGTGNTDIAQDGTQDGDSGAQDGPLGESSQDTATGADNGAQESTETDDTPGEQDFPDQPDKERFGSNAEIALRVAQEVTGHQDRDDINHTDVDDISTAVELLEHFDEIPTGVNGFRFIGNEYFVRPMSAGTEKISESILGPSLLHMRRAMSDNARADRQRNKKSGRVNARVLGRRAWNEDDRLFTKKTLPGKRDYAVVIGIDASGSTWSPVDGSYIYKMQIQAAHAQAELCHRMGIKFAVYAHSSDMGALVVYKVKEWGDRWDKSAIRKLNNITPLAGNLDGHSIEFYRKVLDKVNATDKIMMYYSDGKMPAENGVEELRVLKSEILTCKRKGYTLMAVGARTDSPKEHGLDTVRINRIEDIPLVVKHLGKRIEQA